MADYSRYPTRRVEFPNAGARRSHDYDVRTEAAAREALARVQSVGTVVEKEAVREAVKRYQPQLGKYRSARDLYPNSNMKD